MNDKYFSRDNLELVIDGLKIGFESDNPDWNQNDKNATNYIENKPFYTEYSAIVDNYSGSGKLPKCNFVVDNTYDVIWNGFTYKGLVCRAEGEYNCIGGNGYPFYIDDNGGDSFYIVPESGFTVSILSHIVHQLDEKYIPDSVARVDAIGEVVELVDNAVAGKMDTNNPIGTGSFSMGRKSGTHVGAFSVATGGYITASGSYSHAEGYGNIASGDYSHAEGGGGRLASEEGITTASGTSSHAEGGGTKASGSYSHAEGGGAEASGKYSHAEGRGTLATRRSQHVQGEYNVSDTESSLGTRGKYAHIVGNGTSDTKRSNAHTLDWEGNAWYAGDVYVGSTSGTNRDEGSKKLITLSDIKPNILPLFDTWYRLEDKMEVPYPEGYNFNTYYNSLTSGVPTIFIVGFEELDLDTGGYICENDVFTLIYYSSDRISLSYDSDSSRVILQLSESGIFVSLETKDEYINSLIDAKLAAIPNAAEVAY